MYSLHVRRARPFLQYEEIQLLLCFFLFFKKELMGSVYVICLIPFPVSDPLVPGPENVRYKLQPLEKNYAFLLVIIPIGRCNMPFQPWCSFWRSVPEIIECSGNRSFFLFKGYLGSALLFFFINISKCYFSNSVFFKIMSSFRRKCEHNSICFCHLNICNMEKSTTARKTWNLGEMILSHLE